MSVEYLRRFGMKGIVKVDYLWDQRVREYKILEIEPHYGVWHLLGSYAGMNLAAIACRDQRAERTALNVSRPRRTSLLYFRPDLKAWWSGYRKTGWSAGSYLRSILRIHCYRIFDVRDVRPFLASLAQLWRRTRSTAKKERQRKLRPRVKPGSVVSSGIASTGVLTANSEFSRTEL